MALDSGKLECGKCRFYDAQARALLGCAEPVEPAPYQFRGCYLCPGNDPACTLCGGTDRWELQRCPGALVDIEAILAVHAAALALDHGVLPMPGSVHDQTVDFLAVMGMLGRERNRRIPKPPKGTGGTSRGRKR